MVDRPALGVPADCSAAAVDPLGDAGRVWALRECGLTSAADPSMDRFADMVRAQLRVPVALVSLVEADRQVFPGMRGLPAPWAQERATPLSHSFCKHVVVTAEPLVVTDSRVDPRVLDNLAIRDLDVISYAGHPVTDSDGRVLGSLCAIDHVPRRWTSRETDALAELAAACSTELRLRIAVHRTTVESERAEALAREVERALDRSVLLLDAAQAFNSAATPADVHRAVADLAGNGLAPSRVDLLVAGAALPGHVPAAAVEWASRQAAVVSFDGDGPGDFPGHLVGEHRAVGVSAAVYCPLVGTAGPLGLLVFGWEHPHAVDANERAVFAALGAYTAQALQRVLHLEDRVAVARHLQQAMLTEVPEVPGLGIAARYLPAGADDIVGGDWYDVLHVPDPAAPGGTVLAVTVGDITGHNVQASALMGQVRSMMRQAAWAHPGSSPSAVVAALEQALVGIPVPADGSLLHTHLRPHRDGSGRWTLRYTNAGHPPPVVVRPEGTTTLLHEHDLLFGHPRLLREPRRDHEVTLEPGTTVFLYTDGLVERRHVDVDETTDALRALLVDLAGSSPRHVVDTVVGRLLPPHKDDDTVAVVITVPPA